jgi:hypothetical protein
MVMPCSDSFSTIPSTTLQYSINPISIDPIENEHASKSKYNQFGVQMTKFALSREMPIRRVSTPLTDSTPQFLQKLGMADIQRTDALTSHFWQGISLSMQS